ncbi:MAG: hypothetical protein ACETWQ_11300 [Phycisphaerae bacterium]
MEGKGISNIEQGISNDEGQKEVKGYQGNRGSGYQGNRKTGDRGIRGTGYQVEGGFN